MEWKISPSPVAYEDAVASMEARVRAIREENAPELVWLLEHPALYTAGSSANDADLIDTLGFPVYNTGRGGQYTYHGPGQRIAYVMLDLKKRGGDLRAYVRQLEEWIIQTLATLGVHGFTREGRVGVWVDCLHKASVIASEQRERSNPAHPYMRENLDCRVGLGPPRNDEISSEQKIAALGVRVRQWVSYHGIALNVNPDLSHYRGIVPCGIREYGVTSLAQLGISADMETIDDQLKRTFDTIFKH